MTINRIVSFLPSATELIYEMGMQDRLCGVTHECRYPHAAGLKPRIIDTVIDSEKLSSKEIDAATSKLLKEGRDIFVLDEDELKKADPDMIISQNTCKVCAAYTNQVESAARILEKRPLIHSMDPHSMDEIITSVTELGRVLGCEEKARDIADSLKERIAGIEKSKSDVTPKVLAIEWIDPFFTAGHWIPEMINIAGGTNMISRAEEHSRRMDINEIAAADPDIIVLMPCGFDTKRTVSEYNESLREDDTWRSLKAVRNGRVFAVDADSFFSKPSIRTIEGIEILAKIINPEGTAHLQVSENSFARIRKSGTEWSFFNGSNQRDDIPVT